MAVSREVADSVSPERAENQSPAHRDGLARLEIFRQKFVRNNICTRDLPLYNLGPDSKLRLSTLFLFYLP